MGILGKGKTQEEALQDLIVLVEDDFLIRAHSKIPVKTVHAQDKYINAFAAHVKKFHKPKLSVSNNFDEISKKYSPIFNPQNPQNYEIRQPVF